MKYKYDVESKNLCPNCAAKIEDKIRKIDGVEDVNFAAITRKLRLEVADDADIDKIMTEAQQIADKIEPGTVFVGK